MAARIEWALFEGWMRLKSALAQKRAQGTVEYGFLLAVIALGVAAALYLLRDRLAAFFQRIADTLQ